MTGRSGEIASSVSDGVGGIADVATESCDDGGREPRHRRLRTRSTSTGSSTATFSLTSARRRSRRGRSAQRRRKLHLSTTTGPIDVGHHRIGDRSHDGEPTTGRPLTAGDVHVAGSGSGRPVDRTTQTISSRAVSIWTVTGPPVPCTTALVTSSLTASVTSSTVSSSTASSRNIARTKSLASPTDSGSTRTPARLAGVARPPTPCSDGIRPATVRNGPEAACWAAPGSCDTLRHATGTSERRRVPVAAAVAAASTAAIRRTPRRHTHHRRGGPRPR